MAISHTKSNHNKLTQMPSKLRKAIGVVKDQTSLSLAKVSITTATTNAINLEIAILKATSHHETPTEPRHVADILHVIASDRGQACAAARAIGKRVGKSRNWVVALKSLALVLSAFREGDPHFPKEVRRGTKMLNLSGFRDDSNPRPWDFASFVRAFALYLDERLDCQISDKLHRLRRRRADQDAPKDDALLREMGTEALIDRVTSWQRLLDRSVAAKPAGEAMANRLVQTSLYAIVQESFDLYEDISEGLAVLLDGYFELPYQSCVDVFHVCFRASKQFQDLSDFYRFCQSVPLGRTSDYPSVQKISAELVETLQDFLKDRHVSFSAASAVDSPPPPPSAAEASECSDPGDGDRTGSKGSSPAVDWEPMDYLSSTNESDGAEIATSESLRRRNCLNPFLEEALIVAGAQVAPTFCARNPGGGKVNGECDGDPFESTVVESEGRKSLEEVQQLWLENQKKIITKRVGL